MARTFAGGIALVLCGLSVPACASKSDPAATDVGLDTGLADSDTATGDPDTTPPCLAKVNKGPWVVGVTDTTAKIRWESCFPEIQSVVLTQPSMASKSVKSTVKTTLVTTLNEVPLAKSADYPGTYYMHEVALDALTVGTRYKYSLDAEKGREGEFTTAKKSGEPFTFVAIGDTNPGLGYTTSLLKNVYTIADPVEFTIHGGDLQYYSSGLETWGAWFDFLAPLLRAGSLYPVIGNHESERPNERAEYYERFFSVFPDTKPPVVGDLQLEGNKEFYRFSQAGVAFLALDTEQDVLEGSTQGTWLLKQLDQLPKLAGYRFGIAYMHRPWASCADGGNNPEALRRYTPALLKAGVKLVFSSHVHGYERFEIGGVTFVVTGGGGGLLGNMSETITRDECVNRKAFGRYYHAVKVKVSTGSIDAKVIDDKGVERDSFSIPLTK